MVNSPCNLPGQSSDGRNGLKQADVLVDYATPKAIVLRDAIVASTGHNPRSAGIFLFFLRLW